MSRIVRIALVLMQHFPPVAAAEILAAQLARAQPMRGRLLAGGGDVDDDEQRPARFDALFCRLDQIALQIIGDDDQVPRIRGNGVFVGSLMSA